MTIIEKGVKRRPYNIATGSDVSVADLAKLVINEFNYDPEIKFDITKPSMIPIRRVSVQRAKNELSWTANTNIYDGIRKTCDWFKDNIS